MATSHTWTILIVCAVLTKSLLDFGVVTALDFCFVTYCFFFRLAGSSAVIANGVLLILLKFPICAYPGTFLALDQVLLLDSLTYTH